MPDFRIADTAPEHRKLRGAGLAAAGLWALAGAYAMRELTDGWVPDYWIQTWPAGRKHAATLVTIGLWRHEERDNLPGYRFHDWEFYQRSVNKIDDEKRRARERMASVRAGRRGEPSSNGQEPRGSPERSGEHSSNHHRTFVATAAERAPNVHDSLSLSGGDLGGDRPEVNAPARVTKPPHKPLTSEDRPPERCTRHRDTDDDPGPCRGCLKAREHAEQWDEQRHTEARQAARRCQLCDAEGWRYEPGTRVPLAPYERCDHRPLRSVS